MPKIVCFSQLKFLYSAWILLHYEANVILFAGTMPVTNLGYKFSSLLYTSFASNHYLPPSHPYPVSVAVKLKISAVARFQVGFRSMILQNTRTVITMQLPELAHFI